MHISKHGGECISFPYIQPVFRSSIYIIQVTEREGKDTRR